MDAPKDADEYWQRLRFAIHQAAMRCKTERELLDAMYFLGVIPGTVDYARAKRAWLRLHPGKKDID
jgi:hypothetical protein